MSEVTIGREPLFFDERTGQTHELPVHRAFLASAARFRVLVMHRRARKTSLSLEEVCKFLMANPGSIGKTLAPLRKQAKEIIWDDKDMLFTVFPKEIIKEVNKSELKVTLINGSMYFLDGADNVQNKRGNNVKILHLTEAGDHEEAVWTQVYEPVLKANGGVAIFEGNPRGKNWFSRLFDAAAARAGWASFLLSAVDSPIFTKQDLEDIQRSVPDAVFRSEYLCEWVGSTGMVFRGIPEAAVKDPVPALKGHQYRIGVDLGRHSDYTVVSVVDRTSWDQVEMDRFNGTSWALIKERIVQAAKNYSLRENFNKVELLIETNGIGDPVFEDIFNMCQEISQEYDIMVMPFLTTNASKDKLVSSFSMLLDRNMVKLLRNASLVHEMESFTYTRSGNNYIYSAPEGDHDDIVMATLFSFWQLGEPLKVPEFKEEKKMRWGVPVKSELRDTFVSNPFLIRHI